METRVLIPVISAEVSSHQAACDPNVSLSSKRRRDTRCLLLPAGCNPLACEHGGNREEPLATGPFVLEIIHEFEGAFP